LENQNYLTILNAILKSHRFYSKCTIKSQCHHQVFISEVDNSNKSLKFALNISHDYSLLMSTSIEFYINQIVVVEYHQESIQNNKLKEHFHHFLAQCERIVSEYHFTCCKLVCYILIESNWFIQVSILSNWILRGGVSTFGFISVEVGYKYHLCYEIQNPKMKTIRWWWRHHLVCTMETFKNTSDSSVIFSWINILT